MLLLSLSKINHILQLLGASITKAPYSMTKVGFGGCEIGFWRF